KSLFVLSNCPKPILAPAYNVVASTHVVLDHVWAAGFGDRPVGSDGIRIADSVNLAGIRVRHVISGGYDVGLLLENNGVDAVNVSSSAINLSTTGILVQGTSRAIITRNGVFDNSSTGIQIDAGASGNLIARNVVDGSTTDVVDNGAANCWRNNTYTT